MYTTWFLQFLFTPPWLRVGGVGASQGSNCKPQWDRFSRQCLDRRRFPVQLAGHFQRDKLDLFRQWLSSSEDWSKLLGCQFKLPCHVLNLQVRWFIEFMSRSGQVIQRFYVVMFGEQSCQLIFCHGHSFTNGDTKGGSWNPSKSWEQEHNHKEARWHESQRYPQGLSQGKGRRLNPAIANVWIMELGHRLPKRWGGEEGNVELSHCLVASLLLGCFVIPTISPFGFSINHHCFIIVRLLHYANYLSNGFLSVSTSKSSKVWISYPFGFTNNPMLPLTMPGDMVLSQSWRILQIRGHHQRVNCAQSIWEGQQGIGWESDSGWWSTGGRHDACSAGWKPKGFVWSCHCWIYGWWKRGEEGKEQEEKTR